jgi:hypothetical protein
MLSGVRNYYGLARDFAPAGYFETELSEQIDSIPLPEYCQFRALTPGGA